MSRYIHIILAIILVSTIALADQKIVGHMAPLPTELLDNPIALDCGATIREAKGILLTKKLLIKLNTMCNTAHMNFFTYAEVRHLEITNGDHFEWYLSFLPEATCYRCLNDEAYRMNGRMVKGSDVTGFIQHDISYSFITTTQDDEFSATYLHELFHAMSYHYGVWGSLEGSFEEKVQKEEKMAEEFAKWIDNAFKKNDQK